MTLSARVSQYDSLHFNPLQGRGHFTSKVMINRLTNKLEKQLGHKIDHWASYESFHRHFAFKHLIFIRRDY